MAAGYRREDDEPGVSAQDRWYNFRVHASRPLLLGTLLPTLLLGCSSTATHPRAVPTKPRSSGEAGKPAGVVVADARKALLAAKSVRVTGSFTLTGSGTGASTQRLDLRLTHVRGQPAATGTVTTVTGSGAKRTSVTLALIRLGPTLYIRGDRAYYARIGPKAVAVTGRWLSLPIAQDKAVADVTDVAAVAAGLSPTANDRLGGTSKIGGLTVLQVTAGSDATLYVSAQGAGRPVRLERSLTAAAGVKGTLDFTDYDVPLTVSAPAGAVELNALSGRRPSA
jgi:hypothetical protein